MKRGQRVAYQQLALGGQYDKQVYGVAKSVVTNKKQNPELTIATGNVSVTFDKATGFLSGYRNGSVELMAEGGTLRPNFWRATTDNDLGAGLQKKYKVWRNPTLKLESLTVERGNVKRQMPATVTARYDMPEVSARLLLRYELLEGGALRVSQQLEASDTAKVSDMFRFGMVMTLPNDMDRSKFYGRGPVENYIDRNASQRLGIYEQTTMDQFYPYVRPQETGTKTDVRWWAQTNAIGEGLTVSGAKSLSMSALPYSIETLDEGEWRHQRHPSELETSPFVTLCIDDVQMGVGGINSWGALPLEEHRVHYGSRSFEFTIVPTAAD